MCCLLFCSAPVTAAAFYAIQLQGIFGLFYCVYLATLCVGIGKWAALSKACAPSGVTPAHGVLGVFHHSHILDVIATSCNHNRKNQLSLFESSLRLKAACD